MAWAWPVMAAPKPAGCLIEPDQVADVGSPVTGIIDRLPVALGESVVVGQPLVLLKTDVERANAHVADLRAQVEAEIRAAAANLTLAEQKVHRTRQLLAQQFVSPQALDQAQAEADVAAQKLSLARSQQRIYAQEKAVSQAQLELRTLRSPIKGVLVERFNEPGERVEDRPVVRVATIDPLRVSLMVPMAQYGQVAIGDVLTIRPELQGVAPMRATVRYVDKVVDAASNTFRVRLQLPNPDHRLPGGLRCKVDWAGAPPSRSAPSTPIPRQSQLPAMRAASLALRPSWTLSRTTGTRTSPPTAVHNVAPVAARPPLLSFSLALASHP